MKKIGFKIALLGCCFILNSSYAANYTMPNVQNYSTGIPFRGVSLAGGDFTDDGSQHASHGDFIPTANDAALFVYRGMNVYRIPIVWEYIADINGNLKTDANGQNYLKNLDQLIQQLSQHKAAILLDLHNYMRYNPENIALDYQHTDSNGSDVIGQGNNAPTTQAYANLWQNLVKRYSSASMMYGIMNEPHDISMNLMIANENAAIAGIRAVEQSLSLSSHLIVIDGNYWSGLHSWTGLGLSGAQPSNASVIPSQIIDASHNFAIDVHQYFDNDASGTYTQHDCLAPNDFKNGYTYNGLKWPGFDQYWSEFIAWMQSNHVKVFLGEFGSPDTPSCKTNINYYLTQASQNAYNQKQKSGVIGWAVWAAGGSWGNYVNSIAPGGPANSLMWDNELYQNFLTDVATLPALGPQIASLTNNTSHTVFLYSSGYWPFQLKGSAILNPHSTVYLYSPDSTTVPQGNIGMAYHVGDDNATVLGIGVSDGWGYSYGVINGITPTSQSSCSITGSNGDTKRCWVLNDAS